jgi:bifunctional DNA-binding transcriptional regulator/antitoxin component of YhaV-PrlF toxin-antitoxin module
MVKLQHLVNKNQNKETYTIVVPKDVIKVLNLKKGQEFAVQFNKEKGSIEYIPIE